MQTHFSIVVGTLAGAALALSGCHHRQSQTGVTATTPGMVVSEARLLLPVVKGHPGAAYFTLGNENDVATTLVTVDIVGAQRTEMHETRGGTMAPLAQVRIDPGQRVIFSPSGKHVMAFDIGAGLTPGGSSAITFHFQDGKTVSAPLRIETVTSMGMAGMRTAGKR